MNDKFIEVENQRYEKVKSMIKDFDKFPWLFVDVTLECSLKFIAKVYLGMEIQWDELGGRTLTQYLEEKTMHNKNL